MHTATQRQEIGRHRRQLTDCSGVVRDHLRIPLQNGEKALHEPDNNTQEDAGEPDETKSDKWLEK